ncbi:DEAD/DEAH box helicase family protein [Candidatus Gracilibacteria bacterium]|nr:DEAD/DEAH box helicase family protein [Candidatus Gracilibacteria bacterium]
MFAIISPFSRSFDDIGFTYKIPTSLISTLTIGMVVEVPFGDKKTFGVVLNIVNETNFDKSKIKEILNIYSLDIFLLNYQIELLKWISYNYFCLIHQSLNLFFPKNLVGKITKNKFEFKKEEKKFNYNFNYTKTLSQKQLEIYNKIIKSNNNKFLLYGVTGSGKTEIYINLIKYYLDRGEQSLLLVPEIILTNQIFERIKKVFGDEVIIINSSISESKKTIYYENILKNNVKIIIGTRSSLFYPYNNLGIIIIDEEHDNSYISDISPRYDAIEVAIEISKLKNIKLLLGSGTPKINHMYRGIVKKEFEVLNLLLGYEK